MRSRINGTICYLHRSSAAERPSAGMKEAVLSSGNDSALHIGQAQGISLRVVRSSQLLFFSDSILSIYLFNSIPGRSVSRKVDNCPCPSSCPYEPENRTNPPSPKKGKKKDLVALPQTMSYAAYA